MHTPARAWPLWLAGCALLLLVFPLLIYGSHLYYAEGGTSPDAPGMLLASAVFTFPLWGGAWMLLIGCFLWRYPGRSRLMPFHGATPVSFVLTVVATLLSGLFLYLLLATLQFWKLSRVPFAAYLLAIAGYWQYLRAAAVHRSLVGRR